MRIFTFFVFIIFLSCEENKVRYPLNKKKDFFLKSSANRNRSLLAREEFLIKKAAKLDSTNSYLTSEVGFLYAKIKSINEDIPLPKKGKKVMNKLKLDFESEAAEICASKGSYNTLEKRIEVLEIDETPAYGLETKLQLGINGVIECE